MDLMNDFVNEETINLNIEGYEKGSFKYKPVTAGEENDWANEYIIQVDGKSIQDYGKINKCKMRNIIDVPYEKEHINKLINIDKSWKELNPDERWSVLEKLKPGVFSKIITSINEIDKPKKADSVTKS